MSLDEYITVFETDEEIVFIARLGDMMSIGHEPELRDIPFEAHRKDGEYWIDVPKEHKEFVQNNLGDT